MNLKEQMDLLNIKDVSTTRQHKNGTIVWKLPIKCGKNKFIEVASFKTGYVRNQNSGYSNYQLNKRCEGEPEYFQLANGDYRKFTTRSCILIPNEIDRLQYLIAYCLKNYYIKLANQVVEGKYISKWYHDYGQEQLWKTIRKIKDKHSDELDSDFVHNAGIIQELEEKLDEANNQIKKLDDFYEASNTFNDSMYEGRNDEVKNLENKLATIERIANDRNKWNG